MMWRFVRYSAAVIILLLALEGRSQTVQRCVRCEKALFGEYLQINGLVYHSTCFTCDDCGKPITGRYYTHLSGYFHSQCYEKRFRSPCAACGLLISGEFYEDYWGARYCAGHLDTIPTCDFCGRLVAGPITSNSLRLPDKRLLCGVCRPSAVTSESQAKALMCEVAIKMKSLGLTVDCGRVTVLLLGQDKLRRLIKDPRHAPYGFTEYVATPNEGGQFEVEAFNVLLLYGMPAIQAKAVLAHELMHVWLFGHRIIDIDIALSEGSCEYASYAFLKQVGSPESNYVIRTMRENLDPVYGRGFRDVERYVAANGVAAWLQMLREGARRGAPSTQAVKGD